MLKISLPLFMKALLSMSDVVDDQAVYVDRAASRPKTTPLGLIRMTLPLAVSLPLIWLGLFCEMRFSAIEPLDGCWNCVVSPLLMSKLLQSMMRGCCFG